MQPLSVSRGESVAFGAVWSAAVTYFQLNRDQYFVPLTVKIPGRELALAKRFGSEHTVIDFVYKVQDAGAARLAVHK